jgi:hypothetical protein
VKKTTVSPSPVGVVEETVLPVRVQEVLGELVGAAKEGLLALSVGVGLGVLAELMEEEVVEVVGVKGRHDAERVAVRHGHESGEVTLGGRRVQVGAAAGQERRWSAAGVLASVRPDRRPAGRRGALERVVAAVGSATSTGARATAGAAGVM